MKTLQITGEYLTGEPKLEMVEEALPYVPPTPSPLDEAMEQHWSRARVLEAIRQEMDRQSALVDVLDVLSAYCVALELTQKQLSHPDGCGPVSCWCGLNNAKAAIVAVHQKLDAVEAKRKAGG